MKDARSIGGIAGIISGLALLAGTSSADTLPASPQPPRPLPELTAEWWQWAYSIPQPYATDTAISNPIADSSGASCMVGQRGSIWFLAGTPGNVGPVTRSCSVPEGASIFFPVIAVSNSNTPNCPPPTPPMNVSQLEQYFRAVIEAINQNPIFVTVDGVNVTKTLMKLVQSTPFEFAFPAQNIYGPFACTPANPTPGAQYPLAPGIYSPVVATGYYVWLPPPTLGNHTISFAAASAAVPPVFAANVQNVTYNITVVPVSLK
jgi:hypothetical protein